METWLPGPPLSEMKAMVGLRGGEEADDRERMIKKKRRVEGRKTAVGDSRGVMYTDEMQESEIQRRAILIETPKERVRELRN